MFGEIIDILNSDQYESDSRKEAVSVVTNLTLNGTDEQISYVIEKCGAFNSYCDLMTSNDDQCVLAILTGLKNVFAMAQKYDRLEDFSNVSLLVLAKRVAFH